MTFIFPIADPTYIYIYRKSQLRECARFARSIREPGYEAKFDYAS